ncbi:hypothetical protein RF11_12935 [Thelohanellus kitauei]|uniref:Uncharacterized protein n=1 Tax=Thelohanellus kitauei TaxID=669202 RepID=A0A0C2N620_THEKT|nr:hypothetical protein RF11_12935 [Thelohanellus kitauei]
MLHAIYCRIYYVLIDQRTPTSSIQTDTFWRLICARPPTTCSSGQVLADICLVRRKNLILTVLFDVWQYFFTEDCRHRPDQGQKCGILFIDEDPTTLAKVSLKSSEIGAVLLLRRIKWLECRNTNNVWNYLQLLSIILQNCCFWIEHALSRSLASI